MRRALGALSCALLLLLGTADAAQTFPQLKHFPRDGSYNVTNATTTNSITTSLLPPPPPSIPIVSPIYPANATSFTVTSNTSTTQPSCLGSVTYLNSVPLTVYATITESISVTVTASNVSLPPPQLITPPVACSAFVVPEISNAPLLTLASSASDLLPITEAASSSVNPCVAGVCLPGLASLTTSAGITFQPALTVVTLSFAPAASASLSFAPNVASTVPEIPQPSSTESAFTSTVIVTKKTTVPVVVPITSAPPVFQIPSTTKKSTTTPASPHAGSSKVSVSTAPVQSQPASTTLIGSIIASIINSPFAPVGPASSQVPATPATTSIDDVPVQVLPSSVVVGGQIVPIPDTSSETTLQVNGQTFTVQNSQIIAPGTTYAITPDKNQAGPATATASAVTAGGLTFTVGASQAIISGTTYPVGIGAGSSTAVKVGSETVIIGSGGVVLPSTTVAPARVTTSLLAPEVITAGGITFTVGPSSVVIEGSTYTIGAGAKSTTLVVGGKTISVGSNGIGLASTTIAPEPNFTVVTIGGLTLSVDSSEAILKGTTYKIGKGAPTETTMVGGKTVSLGPGGVGLASTTIPPETAGAPSGTSTSAASLTFFADTWLFISTLLAVWGGIFL